MFLCMIIGFICITQMKPIYLRFFITWLVILCLSEIVLFYFYDYFPKGKLVRIVYCSIYFFGYSIYSYVFYKKFNLNHWFNKYLISTIIIFLLFTLYSLFFRLEVKNSAADTFMFMSILSIILTLYYFWRIIASKETIQLSKEPLFWIATGTLFYYTGNLIATGFFHRLYSTSKEFAQMLYKLNHILAIAQFILFSIAFILSTKKEFKDV